MEEKENQQAEGEIDKLDGQPCPICGKNTLTLMERRTEVPFFGVTYVFSMVCSDCKYNKTDIESEEAKEPAKYEIEVNCEDDMKIRVVKSSSATVKIPRIAEITPGPASNGYVTNIEGVLNRVKTVLQETMDNEEDKSAQKKARNMIKKINRVIWGKEPIKIIISDPTGNSAIISDKAKKTSL